MGIAKGALSFCVCLTALAMAPIEATTIVSETGLFGPNFIGVNGGIGLEVSWSSSSLYTNVTIAAGILPRNPFGTETFFLTTQIGPGTTVANEIAENTVTLPAGPPAMFNIFSGLTLAPGNYFLVLGGPFIFGFFWATTDSPTLTTDLGTTFDGTGVADPNCETEIDGTFSCPYVPATTFDTGMQSQFNFLFDVSGTPVGTPAPEPTSTTLVCVGLLALGAVITRDLRRSSKKADLQGRDSPMVSAVAN
jgi:hypothetical protein